MKITILKHVLLWVIGFTLSACAMQAQQETSSKVHKHKAIETERKSLAGQWQFKIDPYKNGLDQGWWQSQHDARNWDRIQVPGVWDVYDRYNNYTGDAWYRLDFTADPSGDKKLTHLVFDSVYHDAEVWFNDERLGSNHLGFIPFRFDISQKIKEGEINTLTLRVNNRFKRGAVWNWGGIRRPVYLEQIPLAHIKKVYVTAIPDLNNGKATIDLRAVMNNANSSSATAQITYHIKRKGNTITSVSTQPFRLAENASEFEINSSIELSPEDVALWHFNNPNLYNIEATLEVNEQWVHKVTDRFGIRKVDVDENNFYLNGEPVRLAGFNMVPEDRFDGNALPLARIKEDVDLLKSLNANFARLSGPILPKEYLDYLDEVGFLLVEEVGLWGKDALVDPDHPLPKEWLRRLVDDHYNHPSVVAWSVGNEIGDTNKNPKVMEYVEGAIQHAKQLDPTRLAVYISYSADYQKDDPSKFSDIVMFNKYGNHEERLKVVHDYYPQKPIFFSEIGTRLDGVDPNESTYDPIAIMEPLRKYPYLIGASHFAFSDYRSTWYDEKPEWTTDFSQNRSWGVLTSYRTPKRSFKALQNFFSPLENLSLDTSDGRHTINILSRSLESFPAYRMKGYHIVWIAEDVEGNIMRAGQIPLPTTEPGSRKQQFTFEAPQDYAKLNLALLDPTGYLAQEVAYFTEAPKPPKIQTIHSSLDTIRVDFEKQSLAEEYQLIATAGDGKVIQGKKTINNFAEVANLEPNIEYAIELIGHNAVGASKNTLKTKISTIPNELPPIIWATEGKKDAFHIGFSVGRNDFNYEIQYGLISGKYTEQFLISTRGATRVPAIKAGEDHYFRFRRLITGSIDSDWSKEHKVVLASEKGLAAPTNSYLIKGKTEGIISLSPVRGATGYTLKIELNSGEFTSIDSKTAHSQFIILKDLAPNMIKNIQIATKDNEGKLGPFKSVKLLN